MERVSALNQGAMDAKKVYDEAKNIDGENMDDKFQKALLTHLRKGV